MQDTLVAAARTMFSTGQYGSFTLRNGNHAVIQQAKTKHLADIIAFFKAVMGGVDQEQVSGILTIVTQAQAEAMRVAEAQGEKTPKQLSVELLVASAIGLRASDKEINIPSMVERTLGTGQLIVTLLGGVMVQAANFVQVFTNLSKDEFNELDIDEGALVVMAVVMANYSFFTRTLPPIFKGFLGAWARSKMVSQQA